MVPKLKGDTAIGKAISYFLSNDYEVCLPIGDKRKYDLVVEKAGKLSRVQVKYGGLYKGLQRCHVALRVMGGNQSYHSAKKYSIEDFDHLFVYTAKDQSYFLPWNEALAGKSVISIEAPKYSSFRVDMQG